MPGKLTCTGGWLLLVLLCASCRSNLKPTNSENSEQMTPTMISNVTITDVFFDRATYHPGEQVTVSLRVGSDASSAPALLRAELLHLSRRVDEIEQQVTLGGGTSRLTFSFTPPPGAPLGYGLDLALKTKDGQVLAQHTTAFDVLNHWTETPRYGFLSDFAPGRDDAGATMFLLSRYHVNALQFYDWMYRHEKLLADEEPYSDPLGRTLSLETVERLIDAAHEHNIAAMPYTAVYAASIPFYKQHPEWALYHADGSVYYFGDNFLVYMDPRSGSAWSRHLLQEFESVLIETAFDGIHLDQYGAPQEAYSAEGELFDLARPLAEMIDATKNVVEKYRDEGAVVFNAVTNWPVETVAPADQDIVYIEVWDPYIWFEDLHTLIVNAQALGGGKPVVLAAYIDPAWEHNMRLMDAIIFASGGSRIELGERASVLADPYFPNYRPMAPELAEAMRRLYDFAVRYQDVIGPRTHDATWDYLRRIALAGASTNPAQRKNKVWPMVREGEGFTAINLVNLQGVEQVRWDEELAAGPETLAETEVHIEQVKGDVAAVWMASPDGHDIAAVRLPFQVTGSSGNRTLSFTIPGLAYWNLIIVEWVGTIVPGS